MYPLLHECPVCHNELIATRLYCRECDTSIEGRFITGPFAGLDPEQLEFVELFVRNEGKITRMEAELNLSYPTIRNRLHAVIRALGYEPGEEELSGPSEEERKRILESLEQGEINYAEAMRLLQESEV
ncbi:MAG: DUF2089 domain-containing protein [Anaerolineae bacterium]|nr:DUF2089 domain-containing protein [Anaerolineae bacterium]